MSLTYLGETLTGIGLFLKSEIVNVRGIEGFKVERVSVAGFEDAGGQQNVGGQWELRTPSQQQECRDSTITVKAWNAAPCMISASLNPK